MDTKEFEALAVKFLAQYHERDADTVKSLVADSYRSGDGQTVTLTRTVETSGVDQFLKEANAYGENFSSLEFSIKEVVPAGEYFLVRWIVNAKHRELTFTDRGGNERPTRHRGYAISRMKLDDGKVSANQVFWSGGFGTSFWSALRAR